MSITPSSYLLFFKKCILRTTLICLCALNTAHVFSQTSEPTTETNPSTADTTTDKNTPSTPTIQTSTVDELLAQQSPSDQVMWLTTDEEKFLGLYIREESGHDPYGATLILADHGYPADGRAHTRHLRHLLPKHGWHTLAINPSKNVDQLHARLSAALAELKNKNITNFALIAEGHTAIDAIDYIYSHAGQLQAIVLINPSHHPRRETINTPAKPPATDTDAPNEEAATPQTTPPQTNPVDAYSLSGQHDELLTLISSLSIPCLDVVTEKNSVAIEQATRRLTASKTLKKGQYQQILLTNSLYPENPIKDNALSKRIRGWLNKQAVPPPMPSIPTS